MVISCLRLTDVTHYEVLYDSYRCRERFEGGLFVRNVDPRGKTEFTLTVKMETRHPVKCQFGSEFPAICNHCGVLAA